MDADFKLNITRGSGRDFLSDLPTPAQNPVLPFKKTPHTSLLQRYDPSRHPEGLQPSSRYFSSPVLLSQCHRAERVMLRRRKHSEEPQKEPCKSQMY